VLFYHFLDAKGLIEDFVDLLAEMLFPHHFRVGFRFVRFLPLQVLDHVSCRFDQLSQSRQLVVAVIADLFDPAADF